MVTAERVALRFARGLSPVELQVSPINTVLKDLGQASLFRDFDVLHGLFVRLSKSHLVSQSAATEAAALADKLRRISGFMQSEVRPVMTAIDEFMESA